MLGLSGESITVEAWPRAGETDRQAEIEIAWLKAVIQAVRRIRSELNLPPAKPLGVCFQAGDDKDRALQESLADLLTQLARIESMEWVDESFDTSSSAVELIGSMKLLIPLKGLVNVDDELVRLNRELSRESQDLQKSESKLANSRFVDNAPPEVVEQERERLEKHRKRSDEIRHQIRQMEALRV